MAVQTQKSYSVFVPRGTLTMRRSPRQWLILYKTRKGGKSDRKKPILKRN
jgi:hypothetical protein